MLSAALWTTLRAWSMTLLTLERKSLNLASALLVASWTALRMPSPMLLNLSMTLLAALLAASLMLLPMLRNPLMTFVTPLRTNDTAFPIAPDTVLANAPKTLPIVRTMLPSVWKTVITEPLMNDHIRCRMGITTAPMNCANPENAATTTVPITLAMADSTGAT